MTRAGRSTIAARLLLVQVVAIAILTGAITLVLFADARADARADAASTCLAVATSIADNPFVLASLEEADPSASLQPYAVELMADTAIDFITILDPDRTRYTHPDSDEIGRPFLGTIEPALGGESFTETYSGTLGPSVRAVVPVIDADGEVVALVAAGVTVDSVTTALAPRVTIVLAAAAITLLVGVLGAWLLSRYLRRVTGGRGPEELGRMFGYYEAVLHSVREGLLLVDAHGVVTLYNDHASELLGLPATRRQEGIRVGDLGVPERLQQLIASGEDAENELHVVGGRVLVVNQQAARRDAALGTVTILRDHTELRQLSGELETMRTLSDALRSQTHEFSNRLHTIIALIELGRAREALSFAADELVVSEDVAEQLGGDTDDPVLVALLMGKAAQARERGISFEVDAEDWSGSTGLGGGDAVTVIGNLLDNAMDAVAPRIGDGDGDADASRPPRILLTLTRVGDGGAVLRIADNGPGVTDGDVFERGYSTKEVPREGRGIGLALVRQVVERLGGGVEVESSEAGATFVVTLPAAGARSVESAGSATSAVEPVEPVEPVEAVEAVASASASASAPVGADDRLSADR